MTGVQTCALPICAIAAGFDLALARTQLRWRPVPVNGAPLRFSLTQIEIEAIGAGGRKAAAKPKAEAGPAKTEAPAAAPKAETPKAAETATPERTAHPPKGYEEMTVAQIAADASSWRRPNLEAALDYEKQNAKRKGAIAALEAALAEKESH